jgi:hypothetical protein
VKRRGGGGGRYVAGWYERDGSRLYVSRGLATPSTPVRLDGHPELAMFTFGHRDSGRCLTAACGGRSVDRSPDIRRAEAG